MTTHRFAVNVPNPEPSSVTVELGFQQAGAADLQALLLQVPKAELEIERAGISLDPCDAGERGLKRRLRAHSSIDVYATVVTQSPANPAKGGTAALQLTDRRNGKVVGGVLLACIDPPMQDGPGQDVPTRTPCPVTLSRAPYAVEPDTDPSSSAPQTIPSGATVDLVARLTNTKRPRLTDVTAYLEHLGGSDAQFTPAVWNIGTLRQDDVFYATWRVTATGISSGSFEISIVVQSKGTDPTRLKAPIRIGSPKEPSRSRTRKAARR
jgi:hypothetical protein